MHDSDRLQTSEDTRSQTAIVYSDDMATDGADERNDSGIDSLDPRSLLLSSHSFGVLDSIEEGAQEGNNLCSMDLDKAISAMNIGSDSPTATRDKDSGIFLSFMSHSGEQSVQQPLPSMNFNEFLADDKAGMEVEGEVAVRDTDDVSIGRVRSLAEINNDGDNHLNLHIINERTEAALQLINYAPDYDWLCTQNTSWQTPLHLAVATRQAKVVRRLICAGAIVTIQDHQGNTPLHCACARGDQQIVRHFLVPVQYEETRQNSYKIPFQPLPQSSSIRNFEGETCLHIAARSGHLNIVRMLLEAGADPNVGDGKAGRTVLHYAAESGNEELVRLLIARRKVDLNALDYAKRTPARLAYGRVRMSIVRLLERYGASVVTFSDNSDNDWHESDMEYRHDASG